jgi:Leucine-rich repeat (LRR) protein
MQTTKPLTKELLVKNCHTDKLSTIKKINFFGNEFDDLSILAELPNVEVVSLSQNKITSLKEFAYCHRVQEIYLRKNCISDITEVNYLARLPYLKVLWL